MTPSPLPRQATMANKHRPARHPGQSRSIQVLWEASGLSDADGAFQCQRVKRVKSLKRREHRDFVQAVPTGCTSKGGRIAHSCSFTFLVHAAPMPLRISPPPRNIPSGRCLFTGPWTVTRSSLRTVCRVAAFCRPLRPGLLLVSFPRSRRPVVGVLRPPSSGPQPASLRFRAREAQVPCSSTRCPGRPPRCPPAPRWRWQWRWRWL